VSMDSASVPTVRDESRHSILMVTTDEPLFAMLRGLLKLEGYRVLRTTSLDEAWRMIEAGAPDALMLDTQLPDGSGLELVKRLRAGPGPHPLPIFVVSPHLSESEGVVAPLAVTWLVKPFDETRLLNLLRFTLRPPGKARVLVVDDDVSLRHVMRTLLERLGAQCYEAEDGDSAVALAREKQPDLIILDVNLPRMDGFEVVDLLRQGKSRTTPLIVFTGRELTPEEHQQLTLGTTCHLSKARASDQEMVQLAKWLLNGLLMPHDVRQEPGKATS
jgi:DNA-binding response OmpR family regulator